MTGELLIETLTPSTAVKSANTNLTFRLTTAKTLPLDPEDLFLHLTLLISLPDTL